MLTSPLSTAEIYKYQDENGKWHFTDKRPAGHKPDPDKGATPKVPKPSRRNPVDLNAAFQEKFQSQSPIERATLSVVTIETATGLGSGFFISEQGHIITNKHVVRPSLEEMKKRLEKQKRDLGRAQKIIAREDRNLSKYAADIRRFEQSLEGLLPYERREDDEDLRDHQERYSERLRDFNEDSRVVNKRKKEYSKAQSTYRKASRSAKSARRFKVVLKDQSTVDASLVELSKTHDLALLKIDGYKTKPLAVSAGARARQGQKVYAVGSPMGLKDYVTSGVVARVSRDEIVTDTQILPGNSGGPLIDEQGNVLGVNTFKQTAGVNAFSQGFGVAISIDTALQDFGAHLGAH